MIILKTKSQQDVRLRNGIIGGRSHLLIMCHVFLIKVKIIEITNNEKSYQ